MSASPRAHLHFETARLRVRPLAESDRELYCALYTDPETMRFIGSPLGSEPAIRSFAKALCAPHRTPVRDLFFTVIERRSNRPIGLCSLQHLDLHDRSVEAGMILRADVRARGYAREGLAALVARAFAVFEIDEVWVQASANHAIAQRLVIGVGFTRDDDASADRGGARQVWRISRTAAAGAQENG